MGLLYKTIHNNGSLELCYSKPLNPQNIQKLLCQPGISLSSCLTILSIQPTLSGGKGAFRQLMRNVGRTTNKSNNQSMARDLNGRRIRDVENEKRLQDWVEGAQDREQERDEERKARLEKMAKNASDEKRVKTYLDASFDEESTRMMEAMDEAVQISLKTTSMLEEQIGTLGKTITELKRPAGYEAYRKQKKRARAATGFAFDDETFSDEDVGTPNSVPSSSGSSSVPSPPRPNNGPAEIIFIKPDVKKPVESSKATSGKSTSTKSSSKVEKTPVIDLTKPKPVDKQVYQSKMTFYEGKENEEVKSYAPINLNAIKSVDELTPLGRDHLKNELQRRSVKFGGTVEQLADRLMSIRGLRKKEIPTKLRIKK